jgi:uncharacterized protein (TIGR02284 family)
MADRGVIKTLGVLYRIVEAGERGFATAAANVKNRCLKVVFKSYAQQRAKFKKEILTEIQRLGGEKPRSSIRGVIHRGRLAILAAMTIGEENREMVILKEAVIGESVAVRTYQKALEKELPPKIQAIIQRQYEEIQKVTQQVSLMRGQDGKRLIVRLFDTEKDAEMAVHSLETAGFAHDTIEKIDFKKVVDLYEGKGITVLETVISGAVGGTIWSSLAGVVIGFGVAQTSLADPTGSSSTLTTWVLITLVIIAVGAALGAFLGLVIGAGVSEEDTYLYDQSMKQGQVIVQILVDESRAREVERILDRGQFEPGPSVSGTPV